MLDDGWFRGRRDDHAGLGDWYVDEALWPSGLTPLIDAVTSRGMEFGFWVEPEMVNLDSDVVRAHPEWIVGPSVQSYKDGGRLPLEWRHQHIIDLVNPDAWQYIYDRVDALLRENNISYLKWDQNRDLLEHGHAGRASVHEQTLAAYRLFDALKAAHPGVEIEAAPPAAPAWTWASWSGRTGSGPRTATTPWNGRPSSAGPGWWSRRSWWAGTSAPPPRTPPPARTTCPSAPSPPCSGTSAWNGTSGRSTACEREELKRFIGIYKEHRGLIHSGRMVRADLADDSLMLHGVVAGPAASAGGPRASRARRRRCSPWSAPAPHPLSSPAGSPSPASPPTRTTGWKRSSRLRATPTTPARSRRSSPRPGSQTGATASGRFLAEVGLPMPVLNPEHALLLKVTTA